MSKLPTRVQQQIDDFFATTAMSFGEMSVELRASQKMVAIPVHLIVALDDAYNDDDGSDRVAALIEELRGFTISSE